MEGPTFLAEITQEYTKMYRRIHLSTEGYNELCILLDDGRAVFAYVSAVCMLMEMCLGRDSGSSA